MPILRCPECSAVVAWRGKSLAFPCPNDHGGETWSGNGWREDSPLLHVDRDGIERNGHGIDVHHDGAARRDRAADAFDESMRYLRANAAKGRKQA